MKGTKQGVLPRSRSRTSGKPGHRQKSPYCCIVFVVCFASFRKELLQEKRCSRPTTRQRFLAHMKPYMGTCKGENSKPFGNIFGHCPAQMAILNNMQHTRSALHSITVSLFYCLCSLQEGWACELQACWGHVMWFCCAKPQCTRHLSIGC